MLCALRQHIAARRPLRKIPISDALAGRSIRREPCDACGGVRQHGGLPGAGDDDEVTRLLAGDPRAEDREGGDGADVRPVHRILGDEVRRHGMAHERDGLAAGETPRKCGHLIDFRRQRAGAFLHVLHPAAHGTGVPAMAREIEGHGGVAAMGEGQGHRLHELLGAGESMGDQGDLPIRGSCRPEGRGGDLVDQGSLDDEACARAQQAPATRSNRKQRQQEYENMSFFHRAGTLFRFDAPRTAPDSPAYICRKTAFRMACQATTQAYKNENCQSSFTLSDFWASIDRFTNGPGLDQAEK